MKVMLRIASKTTLLLASAFMTNYIGSDAVEVANHKGKEYIRDESKSAVEVSIQTNRERVEKACGRNERVLDLRFTTDDYGYETSFELLTLGRVFASGPSSNANFADDTTYSYKYCVKIGQRYKLKMKDKMGDGICCNVGEGSYRFSIDGETLYNSGKVRTFTSVGSHGFTVKARPSSQSNHLNLVTSSKNDSTGCITVSVKSDKNADELSWSVVDRNDNQVATSPNLKALVPVSKKVCLPSGQYEVVLRDKYGDGLCCGSGNGYFTIDLDGREIIRGTHFKFQQRYKVHVKPRFEDNMSARDNEWLIAHNTRRRKYHREFRSSYVPLQWSPQLAAQAKQYANKLLGDCNVSGIRHAQGVQEGENLAKNKGTGSWGNLYPADNILKRWVEDERYVGYPRNAHMTQCLW
eukprot:CAMPEP_0181115294 /NCGR_PEP_ID=MMETSP1071-20121207/21355_1 /TAXON_ID=35127 /ORGANISM="Thalassiosira sp., Strain NH16" /LENGTH=407 /DNA_ID=CAMNT_0023199491 /DNA_START=184 /DNA_END=1404 /DNA_ORIENTATION=-